MSFLLPHIPERLGRSGDAAQGPDGAAASDLRRRGSGRCSSRRATRSPGLMGPAPPILRRMRRSRCTQGGNAGPHPATRARLGAQVEAVMGLEGHVSPLSRTPPFQSLSAKDAHGLPRKPGLRGSRTGRPARPHVLAGEAGEGCPVERGRILLGQVVPDRCPARRRGASARNPRDRGCGDGRCRRGVARCSRPASRRPSARPSPAAASIIVRMRSKRWPPVAPCCLPMPNSPR